MLGLILDNILVYLFRTVVRLILEYRSERWPITTATLEESACSDSFYPEAELGYTYVAESSEYWGTSKRAFWWKSSAKRYADQFTPKCNLVVRYNPLRPAKTVMRERDQQSIS
jgi:hypothetical protein